MWFCSNRMRFRDSNGELGGQALSTPGDDGLHGRDAVVLSGKYFCRLQLQPLHHKGAALSDIPGVAAAQ